MDKMSEYDLIEVDNEKLQLLISLLRKITRGPKEASGLLLVCLKEINKGTLSAEQLAEEARISILSINENPGSLQ